jgi:cell division protein FtsB
MPAPPRAVRVAPVGAGAPRPDPGAQQDRPHLHIVPPPRRLRLSRRLVVAALSAGFAGLLMALVALHVLIAQEQFRLNNLQSTAASGQASYEKLRLAVAELESPARIVSVAEGRLGMRQPGSVTYLPPLRASTRSGGSWTKLTGSTGAAPQAPASGSPGTQAAPSGDADWPAVKPYLSGSP